MLIYLNAWFFHYTGITIIFEIAEKKSTINLFQSLVVLRFFFFLLLNGFPFENVMGIAEHKKFEIRGTYSLDCTVKQIIL